MDPYKFREMVFQLLFSIDVGDSPEGDLVPFLMRELSVARRHVQQAFQKARAVWEQRETLDERIGAKSRDYAFERIGRVERNILRLAFFELLIEKGREPKIVIAEALRLTKKFSTPEAVAYVNAIVDDSVPLPDKQTSQ